MARAARLWTPTPRQHPDEWAAQNVVYAATTGVPGPRNVGLTPYLTFWLRSTASGAWKRTVIVCGAQMGKTEGFLDLICERLDTRPAPILYVGPSEQFNRDQFGPRLTERIDSAKTLKGKVANSKREKMTLRRIAGVRLRLAHAGSSTALKSDPAALGLIDEYDEMLSSVRGQGDPLGLLEARGFTYADFVTAVTSTCSKGVVDVERDSVSGLDFWSKAPVEDLESPIWKIWQDGTRHHWAWPCPHCAVYFVPRLRNLVYDPTWRPARVRRETYMQCPNCKGRIDDGHKPAMNALGRYVAPGQWFDSDGNVCGEPDDTETLSCWVSGLCSPFRSFGERAAAIVEAEESGDPGKKQSAINTGCGELYAPGGGEVPEWQAIQRLKRPYRSGTAPAGAMVLTAAVDVMKNRLVYVVRAWGPRATSWKVESAVLYGPTMEPEVWSDLADVLSQRFPCEGHAIGLPVKIAFVDSGFRPGKPDVIPENMVYEFCRRHSRFVFPTKGYDTQRTPLIKGRIEVNYKGAADKYGLELIRLHTDYWKSWIHERLRWDAEQPGAWYLDAESTEDFARQIVSEARIKAPSGKASWVRRSRENHFLDCEAMNAAAGYLLGVQRIRAGREPDESPDVGEKIEAVELLAPLTTSEGTKKQGNFSLSPNKFAMLSARMNAR